MGRPAGDADGCGCIPLRHVAAGSGVLVMGTLEIVLALSGAVLAMLYLCMGLAVL